MYEHVEKGHARKMVWLHNGVVLVVPEDPVTFSSVLGRGNKRGSTPVRPFLGIDHLPCFSLLFPTSCITTKTCSLAEFIAITNTPNLNSDSNTDCTTTWRTHWRGRRHGEIGWINTCFPCTPTVHGRRPSIASGSSPAHGLNHSQGLRGLGLGTTCALSTFAPSFVIMDYCKA